MFSAITCQGSPRTVPNHFPTARSATKFGKLRHCSLRAHTLSSCDASNIQRDT